jgi:hypothetical protein
VRAVKAEVSDKDVAMQVAALHINSPEDELRTRFRDLVSVGEDCTRHGVKPVQFVGWNDGGQDQGNPSHHHDPRLGTADDLRAAIRAIQALGVHMILFTKFVWPDRATDWFRANLIRQAIKDPWGDDYCTRIHDVLLEEEYLHVCDEEFRKVLPYGADGMLSDECLHHEPALLCFDSAHRHRPGALVYANDRGLIRRFRGTLDRDQRDYLFAGEACYDWEFYEFHLSYGLSGPLDDIPWSRYFAPDTPLMMAVTGFEDRNALNHCLLPPRRRSPVVGGRAGRRGAAPVRRGAIRRIGTLLRRYLAMLMRGQDIATSTPGAKCTSGASTLGARPAADTRSSSRLKSCAARNAYGWCLTRTLHRVAPRCT